MFVRHYTWASEAQASANRWLQLLTSRDVGHNADSVPTSSQYYSTHCQARRPSTWQFFVFSMDSCFFSVFYFCFRDPNGLMAFGECPSWWFFKPTTRRLPSTKKNLRWVASSFFVFVFWTQVVVTPTRATRKKKLR